MNPLRPSNQIGPKQKRKKKTKKTKKSKHTCPYYSNDPAWKDDYIKPNLWPLIQQKKIGALKRVLNNKCVLEQLDF
jgi:hypothetical protein